jgi:hypothetical protein
MICARDSECPKGKPVPKDKKKKDKDDKKKKHKKGGSSPSLAKTSKKAGKNLQALAQNPIIADVVAAALVGMASALKDSNKAKQLASDAGDQLNAMSKKASRQGNAMWDLALDIGRNVLQTLASEMQSGKKSGK